MNIFEIREKFSCLVEVYRLEEISMDVYLRPLSALDRAKVIDKYRSLDKAKDSENAMESMTINAQCFIVARGLVDEKGNPCCKPEEAAMLAEMFPANALDGLSRKILEMSGIGGAAQTITDQAKNLNPSPIADFSSGSPSPSDAGTSMNS
jgi:hypothetical protein